MKTDLAADILGGLGKVAGEPRAIASLPKADRGTIRQRQQLIKQELAFYEIV